MGVNLSEDELARLDEMQRRVEVFLACFEESPLYDFSRDGVDMREAKQELLDVIKLYAKGGVDERGVEAIARSYALLCKRPGGVPVNEGERKDARRGQGDDTPPAPPPGTYPGRTQANLARRLSRPASVERHSLAFDEVKGEREDLCPDVWRYARLTIDYTPSSVGYFREAPLKAGDKGYAKLHGHSIATYADRPEIWHVQFYNPVTRISYYFPLDSNAIEAYGAADHQARIEEGWSKGFQSRK